MRWLTVAAAVGFLLFGGWLFQFAGKTFFPISERTQLQVVIDLPVGANSEKTEAAVHKLHGFLTDADTNPEIVSTAAYTASGGPRFYLSLEPIDSFPNAAYMLVNVKKPGDVDVVSKRLNAWALANVPEARVTPKKMSMGRARPGWSSIA